MRHPIVAGQFYPGTEDELREAVKQSFKHKFGPGLPKKRGADSVIGAIAPHAGYFFSGAGAAHVYKSIGEGKFPDCYLILGVNHSGPRTCVSSEDWKTPLGTVKTDQEFVSALSAEGVDVDDDAHHFEHSIEVQLPFLQHISTDRLPDLKVVCLMIADSNYKRWADAIESAVKSLGRHIVVICSSDFTHYGANYSYVPFNSDIAANMKKLDGGALELIQKNDASGFLAYVEKTGATICGRWGIAVLLELMKRADAVCDVLKYYTSGDITGEYDSVVGYGAVVFRT